MGTKANPAPFDCYANAADDEPMFILLARDKHAPALVWLWSVLRELDDEDPAKVAEARRCVEAMVMWAREHGRKPVGVAQSGLAAIFELIRVANFAVEHGINNATGDDVMRMFLCKTQFEAEQAGQASEPGDFQRFNTSGTWNKPDGTEPESEPSPYAITATVRFRRGEGWEVKPEAEALDGKRHRFTRGWVIGTDENAIYAGETAWIPARDGWPEDGP